MSSTTASEKQVQLLKVILDLESKGGSAGYKAHPERFNDFASQVHNTESREDMLANALVAIRNVSEKDKAVTQLEAIEIRVERHPDPRVSSLLPKFKAAKASLGQSSDALDALIDDVRAVADVLRGPTSGFNNRVSEAIQAIESLGGSNSFKDHLAKIASRPKKDLRAAHQAKVEPAKESWERCHASLSIRSFYPNLVGNIEVQGAQGLYCAGTFWTEDDVTLNPGTIEGELEHIPPSKLVGTDTEFALICDFLGTIAMFDMEKDLAYFNASGNKDLLPTEDSAEIHGRVRWGKSSKA